MSYFISLEFGFVFLLKQTEVKLMWGAPRKARLEAPAVVLGTAGTESTGKSWTGVYNFFPRRF